MYCQLLECTILTIVLVPCRQRKIRCKLEDGDFQMRCANCSKRNKECVFRPVDQLDAVASGTQSSEVGAASVTYPKTSAARTVEDVDYGEQGSFPASLIMAAAYSSLPYESGYARLEKEALLPVVWTQDPSGWEADKLHVFGIDNMDKKTRYEAPSSSSFRCFIDLSLSSPKLTF